MNPAKNHVLSVEERGFLLELVSRAFFPLISMTWEILQNCLVNDVGVKGLYIAQIIERRIEDEENSSHR